MTRQQAIEELSVSLTRAINKWMDTECDGDAWIALNFYIGNDSDRLMAKAAIATLESIVDIQDYLKEDGQLAKYPSTG